MLAIAADELRHPDRQRLCRGLRLLQRSLDYAHGLQRSAWDFSVEIYSLREAGLTNSDLRWLAAMDYVEHAREVHTSQDQARQFKPAGKLTFTRRTCFVLTSKGEQWMEALGCVPPADPSRDIRPAAITKSNQRSASKPRWDADYQQLCLGDIVVKEFKIPALNQVRVLAVFEEQDWPPRIDAPLPPGPEPQSRLLDTIAGLNRQKNRLIEFTADESARTVGWHLRE
jgi:hypothetical protein